MRLFIAGVSLLLILLFSPSFSSAGSITVNPTKLFLVDGKKTDVLKVKNESEDKVTLQVEGVKWIQGEGGKDVYEPTEDILFFPKIFTIEKGKESLLRIGMKNAKSVIKEASYRVFLQEIPVAKPGESQLLLALRISVPVFIKPAKVAKEWSIEKAEFSGGVLQVKIKNSGNSHVSIGKLTAKGLDTSDQEVFQKEQTGWYVLPDVVRTFGIKILRQDCLKSKVIMVTAEEGRSIKEVKLDLDTTLCPTEADESREKAEVRKP